MRIINQNGLTSYNFDDLRAVFVNGAYLCANEVSDTPTILGKYCSQERSLEIFKDIHEKYIAGLEVYAMPDR